MIESNIGLKEGSATNKKPVGIFLQNKPTAESNTDNKPVRAREFNKSFQIEIHRENLIPNPENEKIYNVTEGLEELKESILMNGLINNLVVHQIRGDKGVSYQIVSGERRYRAIMLMSAEEYKEVFPKGIKCNVESAQIDDLSKLMRTVAANRDVRDRDPETIAKEIEVIMHKLKEEKAAGREVPKNIAEYIAKSMNMSVSMVKKYQNYTKIIPELRAETEGILRVPDIEQYGRMTTNEQKKAAELIRKKKQEGIGEARLTGNEVDEIKGQRLDRRIENPRDNIIKKYKRILNELAKLYDQYGRDEVEEAVVSNGLKFYEL